MSTVANKGLKPMGNRPRDWRAKRTKGFLRNTSLTGTIAKIEVERGEWTSWEKTPAVLLKGILRTGNRLSFRGVREART